jgi:hypothetical protein
MSIHFPSVTRTGTAEAPTLDSNDSAPSTWAEVAVTVTVTTLAIVFVSFCAVVMGLA